jgi:hypothetical protein
MNNVDFLIFPLTETLINRWCRIEIISIYLPIEVQELDENKPADKS